MSTNGDNHDGSHGNNHGNDRGNEPLGPSIPIATPIKSDAPAEDPATRRSDTPMHGRLAGGYRTSQNRGQERSHAKEEENPEPKRVKVETSPWAWGPHMTSSDRAEYYRVKMKAMEEWARLRDKSKGRTKHALAHLPSPKPSEKESKKPGHEWSGSRRVLEWLSETNEVDMEVNCEEVGKKYSDRVKVGCG
ncbi:MAG: hypothetical protein Q9173_000174 [Seirophora scorigena]